MIIIYNKIIPFVGYTTINIFSLLFTRKKELSEKLINHEKIHSIQILELAVFGIILTLILSFIFKFSILYSLLGIFTFYIWYCVEYILIRFFHKKQNDAYHDISLEEEAYHNDDNLNYLKTRKYFNWIKYIKLKSY